MSKKTDIIEQLEKGKELLESGEIDVKSLKTKIESEDEKSEEKPKRKKGTSKGNTSDDNISDGNNDKTCDNKPDGDDSGDNISSKSNNRQPDEPKVEKYPGFDFTTMYTVGQTIFYVKVNDMVGEKELQELKLRTIYPKMLVGCLEKAYTQCIGPDTADRIFTSRYEAVQCYDSITVKQRVYSHYTEEE
jgi:hypothetical protein